MSKHKTITQYYEIKLVRDFIETAKLNGLVGLAIADLSLARELNTYQSRSGKINGVDVLAYGNDGLGNVTVLTTNHQILQF
jgi:hypothetical protein